MNERIERCETCEFWVGGPYERSRECHRHAPMLVLLTTDNYQCSHPRWPLTYETNWCGDYLAKSVPTEPQTP